MRQFITSLLSLALLWQILLPSVSIGYTLYDTGELPTERFCMKRGQFTQAPAADQPLPDKHTGGLYAAAEGQLPQPGLLCVAGPQLAAPLPAASESPVCARANSWPQLLQLPPASRSLGPEGPVPKV
ncbi:MAG: hypothetical protein ACOCZ8_01660 [Bacteroidota bacterium]